MRPSSPASRRRSGRRQVRLSRLERLESRRLLAVGSHVAFYGFDNNSAGNAELFSTDSHVDSVATDLSSALFLGWTGNGSPPNGLALGGAFNETTEPTPAGGQPDFFEWTITPVSGATLDLAELGLEIRRNDSDSKDSFSVYFDQDPGPGGDNFTTKLTSGIVTSEDVFETFTVNLEGMPEFTDLSTAITFRVYAWGTQGTNTMRLDNIRVREVLPSVNESAYAYYGDSGRLLHPLDDQGNRIVDFSAAGYRYGNEPIPEVTQTIPIDRVVTVSPTAGDDGATIAAAIAQVAAFPLDDDGYRGVVQLTAGEFQIDGQIEILDDGIVLRGVGDGDDPATHTILRATGTTQRSLVVVGAVNNSYSGVSGTNHSIIDKYVPVGATSVRVDSTANWSVGDPIIVRRTITSDWITALGMDSIPPRSDGGTVNQWTASGNFEQSYERVITRIEGDRVFFNAPITNSIEQQYGGGSVFRFTVPRSKNIGIENIRGKSDFVSPTDENHARSFIELRAVEDAWVRNVTGQHFIYATVFAGTRSVRVTVDGAESLDPVSLITGGRRYPFVIDGQFILMQNLYSEGGRHDFVNNSSWRNRGPNAFVNGIAVDSHSTSGPHQRWSTGTLYDNLTDDFGFEARNRGNFGSGHGWAGANMVFWNTIGEEYIVQNPLTAQNWVIGSSGRIVDETRFGTQPMGTYDAHGTRIDFQDPENPISSLYVAQHNQRLAQPLMKREYVLGDFDLGDYDGSASVDAAPVDPDWMIQSQSIAGAAPLVDLDQPTDDSWVPMTFDFRLDPNDVVRAATVSFGLRSTGGDTTDDFVWWDSATETRSIASLLDGKSLTTDQTTSVLVELTGAELNQLQDGQLNLLFGQHTSVDWAVLDLAVENLDTFDMGDAPGTFGTLLADDGARHGATGPRLGATRDAESDAIPSGAADGDGGDEDGVMFGNVAPGSLAGVNLSLENSAAAKVDAWVDFDADGIWQPDEQIFDDAALTAGLQTLNFSVPQDAVTGEVIARVRVSSVGVDGPNGFAFDGEVEDYPLVIRTAAPQVESVVINGGENQRSMLTEVTVTFDREVAVGSDAFEIVHESTQQSVDTLNVATSVQLGQTIATITFLDGGLVSDGTGSLVDGAYQLTVNSASVTSLGNGLEMAGDHIVGDDPVDRFFRRYGDANGNQIVDLGDFAAFRGSFGSSDGDAHFRETFDADGNQSISLFDFAMFRANFGS